MSSNQFDGSEKLGSVLGEFGWNKGRAKFVLGAWIFMFFISLLASLFLLGLPTLILSIYFIYRSLQRLKGTKPIILLYQQGLIDYRKGTPQVICYEEIKNLFVSIVITNGVLNYLVTLETKNLGKIKIDEHVANISRLRELLEDQLIQLQLPAIIANYQQGKAIEFGRLTLSQAGLLTGSRMLPWSEFESANVERRYKKVDFFIRQKGNKKDWFYSPRSDFPNLALFLTFVNYITASQGQTNMP